MHEDGVKQVLFKRYLELIYETNSSTGIMQLPWKYSLSFRLTMALLSFSEEVIAYIKQTVEEERERNAENRAALEAELMEARRSSEHLGQLAALRVQLQNTAPERQVNTAEYQSEWAERLSLVTK